MDIHGMTYDPDKCGNCMRRELCAMGVECTVSDEVEITNTTDTDRVFLTSDGLVHKEYCEGEQEE